MNRDLHLVVIEDDFRSRQELIHTLRESFGESITITEFKNAGDFLLALGTLPTTNAIIMEHFLPLIEEGRRDIDQQFRSLFPANWNRQEAAERLVRHMRKTGVQTPVIIYTHSDREHIDADVLDDPHVVHCMKCSEMVDLITIIKGLCV